MDQQISVLSPVPVHRATSIQGGGDLVPTTTLPARNGRETAVKLVDPFRLDPAAYDNQTIFISEVKRMLGILNRALEGKDFEYISEKLEYVTGLAHTALTSFGEPDPILQKRITNRIQAIEAALLAAWTEADDESIDRVREQKNQAAKTALDATLEQLNNLREFIRHQNMDKAALLVPKLEQQIKNLNDHDESHLPRSKITDLADELIPLKSFVDSFVAGLEREINNHFQALDKLISAGKKRKAEAALIVIEARLLTLKTYPQSTQHATLNEILKQKREIIRTLVETRVKPQVVVAQTGSERAVDQRGISPQSFIKEVFRVMHQHDLAIDVRSRAMLTGGGERDLLRLFQSTTRIKAEATEAALNASKKLLEKLNREPSLANFEQRDSVLEFLQLNITNHERFVAYCKAAVRTCSGEIIPEDELKQIIIAAEESALAYTQFCLQKDLSWMPEHFRPNQVSLFVDKPLIQAQVTREKNIVWGYRKRLIGEIEARLSEIVNQLMTQMNRISNEMSEPLKKAEEDMKRGSDIDSDNLDKLSKYFRDFSNNQIPDFLRRLKRIKNYQSSEKGKLLEDILKNKIDRDLSLSELAHLAAMKARDSENLEELFAPDKINALKEKVNTTNLVVQRLSEFAFQKTSASKSVDLANKFASYILQA